MPDLRKRRPRRRGPVPRPLEPTGIQLAYYAELKKVLAYARALVHARLLPRLPDLLSRAQESFPAQARTDAQAPGKKVNRLMDQISEAFFRKFPQEKMETISTRIARATSEHQKAQLFRQVKASVGVELGTIADRKLLPRVKHFVSENVALIKTVPQLYFDDVEKRVLAGMRAGVRHEDLAVDLEARLGVSEERARLIARDQVLSFNGDLNNMRQQDLGLTSYIWRTVKDERVRSEHADRDGQVYQWDDPPGDPEDPAIGGHPGVAILCRCFAEPNVEELLSDSEGDLTAAADSE